jgi:hypothetical protein
MTMMKKLYLKYRVPRDGVAVVDVALAICGLLVIVARESMQ